MRLEVLLDPDTISFHLRLFRCFLPSLLDAHTELASLSEWMSAALGQELPGRVSHRARHNDSMARCPPRSGHDTPPFTSSLYDEAAFDVPGPGPVLGGNDGPPAAAVGFVLLWVLGLVMVMSLCSRTGLGSPGVIVKPTTSSRGRVIRPSSSPMDEPGQDLAAYSAGNVGNQSPMPGEWSHDCQGMPGTWKEAIFDAVPWTLSCSFAQMGMRAWAHLAGSPAIFTAPLSGSDDGDVGKESLLARTGLDDGVSLPATLNEAEQRGLPCESDFLVGSLCGPVAAMRSQHREPEMGGDVAIKHSEPTRTTTLAVVHRDKVGTVSSDPDLADTSSDVDASTSEDESDDTGGERPSHVSASVGKDVHGRRQDGISSDTGCPSSLRRVRHSGYPWRRRDMFDDDGTGDDSYWIEQVNARLSNERDSSRHSWTDTCSLPREGENDNWRVRNSQATRIVAPEKPSDRARCRADDDGIKPCRYSLPFLNADPSSSHRTSGAQGIYVVPQKRGGTGRCWSPVSSERPSDRASVGFFPFHKTPPLLTPEAWRPGCLYVPDAPMDESTRAEAWWGSLSPDGGHEGRSECAEDDASRDTPEAPVSWRDRYENDPASRRFVSAHRRAMTEG